MSLADVKKEIIAAAEAKASKILGDKQQLLTQEHLKALQSLSIDLEEENKKFHSYLEQLENRELASAKLEAKKYLFDAKKQLLAEAYTQSWDAITSFSGSERTVFIKALLAKAKKELDFKQVYCNSQDKNAVTSVVNTVSLKVQPIEGGIIVENNDGTVKVDYSFETIFEQIKETSMQNVAKTLFS